MLLINSMSSLRRIRYISSSFFHIQIIPLYQIIEMQDMRLILSGLIFTLIPLNIMSQADSTSTSDDTDRHALYAGAGYGSNMIYLGSTISQNLPYGYGALSYILGGELSLTGSAFFIPAYGQSAPAFGNISIYYSHDFTKWLDISTGVSRYIVRPSLTDTLFSNFNYADIKLGIDWKILYTEVSYGRFLIKDPPSYLQVRNSRYFETPSFFRGKANISFYPLCEPAFRRTAHLRNYWNGTEVITTTQTLVTPISPTGFRVPREVPVTGQTPGAGSGSGQDPSRHRVRHRESVPLQQPPLQPPLQQQLFRQPIRFIRERSTSWKLK